MCKISRFNILDNLSDIGHQSFLYAACLKSKNVLKNSDKFIQFHSSVPGVQLLNFLTYQLKSIFRIPYLIFNNKIDTVICDINSTPAILPLLILKKIGVIDTVFVLDFRSNILHNRKNVLQSLLKSLYLNIFIKLSSIMYDGFTFISHSMKKYIVKKYHIKINKSAIWSSGVSNDFLVNKNPMNKSEFIIFHHGSLERGRGIIRLINAMPLIKLKFKRDIKLIIAGNGSLEGLIKKKSTNKEYRLDFKGQLHQKEIIQLIDSSSICLAPFDNSVANATSSPLKLMEYIARDKIIYATELSNFKESFSDYTGLHFLKSNNSENIAIELENFFLNYEDYFSKNKNNGRDIIMNDYTWLIQAKKIDNFIKKLY
tara:strand:+ start:33153 stop:34262 length:1110 start_codon:yes stop_codon:yes gene_type:complete